MTFKETWARWRRSRRNEETLEDLLYKCQHADYTIETGAVSLFEPGTFKDWEPEELRQFFLDEYGIDIVNKNAGPTWI